MKLAAKQIPALDALIKQRDHLLSERDSLRTELPSALAANAETLQQYGDRLPYVPNGTHLAFMPQRYTDNLQRYVDLGGKMKPTEDISGFIRYNPTYALDQARFFMFSLIVDLIAKETIRRFFGARRGQGKFCNRHRARRRTPQQDHISIRYIRGIS
jgi:hypothetical protein